MSAGGPSRVGFWIRSVVVRRAKRGSNAIDYVKFYSGSHDAVIRVYDDAGNVIERQEQAGEFREW
jgi:hypothetical protein